MPILGNKISEVKIKLEKEGGVIKGVKNNLMITEIEEKKVGKESILQITAKILTTYINDKEAPIAQFFLAEELLYNAKEAEKKELLKSWEKDKKLPKKMEKDFIKMMETICLYDVHFFTNKLQFPPSVQFDLKKE